MESENERRVLSQLKEGDRDPVLGKDIRFLIQVDEDKGFIVYLDQNLEIQWYHFMQLPPDGKFGQVLNRVAQLESSSRFIELEEVLLPIKRLLAEGIARYLDFQSFDLSSEVHDLAQSRVLLLNKKIAWGWYFDAANSVTTFCLALWAAFWLARQSISPYLGHIGLEVIFGGLIGSVGAIISVIVRGDQISLDANAGDSIHRTEGAARIVVGVAGALLISLAFKGGLLLNGIQFSGNQFSVLLALSIIAGASERLVPSLVQQVELNAMR